MASLVVYSPLPVEEKKNKKKVEKFVLVDKGDEVYRTLLMAKKVCHFRSEFSQLEYNAHLVPSARSVMLELNARIDACQCDDEKITVDELLNPKRVDDFDAAVLKGVQEATEAQAVLLPSIGTADYVVHFARHDFSEAILPAHIEFAANAVLAKFKKTGIKSIHNVALKELNDTALIEQAKMLFGDAVGRLVFRHPFEPYCTTSSDCEGSVAVYMFRVRPDSRWKVVKADDVWTLKTIPKTKSEQDEEKENQRDEIFTVMKNLFHSTKTVERSHSTHFDKMTIKRLQTCFEVAFERKQFGNLNNIGSYMSLRDAAIGVLKTDDLMICINFLFFYFVYLWPYNIRGDRMDANATMRKVKNFVKAEVKRFNDSNQVVYQRPEPKANDDEEEESKESKGSKKPASAVGKKRIRDDDDDDDDDE